MERLLGKRANARSLRRIYYEDLPYACREQRWESIRGLAGNMDPAVSLARPEDWLTKLDAIQLYESQARMLWPSPAEMVRELETYALIISGTAAAERFWIPRTHSIK